MAYVTSGYWVTGYAEGDASSASVASVVGKQVAVSTGALTAYSSSQALIIGAQSAALAGLIVASGTMVPVSVVGEIGGVQITSFTGFISVGSGSFIPSPDRMVNVQSSRVFKLF